MDLIHAAFVALAVSIGQAADDELDVPIAAWNLPADALQPANRRTTRAPESRPSVPLANEVGQSDWASPRNSRPKAPPARDSLPIRTNLYEHQWFGRPADSTREPNKSALPMTPGISSPDSLIFREQPSTLDSLPPEVPRRPTPWIDDTATYGQQIAAIVDGHPILKSDVLLRYCPYLPALRKEMQRTGRSQQEYNNGRDLLLQKHLPACIQLAVAAKAMESSLNPTELEQRRNRGNHAFKKLTNEKILRQFEVTTLEELEETLPEYGLSIEGLRKNYVMLTMAEQYVSQQLSKSDLITQEQIESYYKSHSEDYNVSASIEWDQIQITFFDGTSKMAAKDSATQALQELKNGSSASSVARKYSDGPTAKQGGRWKAMNVGTFPDKKLEQMMLEMPLDQWSEIYESPTELQIVRVVSRRAAGLPLPREVEREIRRKLNAIRVVELLNHLYSEAKIESEFDLSEVKTNKLPIGVD